MASSVARHAVRMAILRVLSLTFLYISPQPPLQNLEPDYIVRKPMKHRLQRYIVRQESPHWLQWYTPNSPQNSPFPFDDHHQNVIHPVLDRPLSPPKRHPYPINCFGTVHFADRPTDWDRWSRRAFHTMSALARYAYRQQHAKNIFKNFIAGFFVGGARNAISGDNMVALLCTDLPAY